MPDVTINTPSIGLQSYFTFKDPINTYFKNKFNLDSLTIKLKVISIISMRDMIRNDLRDPFSEIYVPAGLSELEYKKDLRDEIAIISFSFVDIQGVTKFCRCPINYVQSIADISNKEYINKMIVLDLNRLHSDLDTTVFFTDLADFIESRLGIIPAIKEVNIGDVEFVTPDEHVVRETVRTNMVTVHKTLSTQLEEANLRYDQMVQRLQDLNISLG